MGNPFEGQPPAYDGPGPSNEPKRHDAQLQAVPSGFKSSMASIVFFDADKIQFYRFPEEIITIMHSLFTETWDEGVREVKDYEKARQIRLYGVPFKWDRDHNKETRAMLLKIISTLHDLGWIIYTAADFNERDTSRTSLVFRYQVPAPPPCNWLSVSMEDHNHLRIAPLPHPDLISALLEVFGDEVYKKRVTDSDIIMKFSSQVFNSDHDDAALLNDLMLSMLEAFEKFGYTIYTNFNDLMRKEHAIDLFIFQQQKR
ncbi:unnamed protein product [Clonostachys rosea]|uniref:Uncharacterized protein n=1 Tax=Bionectria ochroleuca TaxID=29856 RepID=A0ABY6V4M8_BIOOC|nr:unnamed protein product [Clonostachys rosea]